MHKGSKTAHIRKKHTVTLTKAVKVALDSSIENNLKDDMELLEEAGVTVDLLDMDPMEESETLEENVDKVQTNINEISQSAILATTDVIESVLNMVHSTTPTPTIASAVPACAGAASFFLLNPEQPIIDLTASQRSLVLPPLPDDTLNDTIEELELDVDNMVEQFQIGQNSKSKCEVCSEHFFSNTELTSHIQSHKNQSFQPLEKYNCTECDFECTSRDKFKEHMKGEHTLETDNDDFELGYLKSWSDPKLHSPDWSAMPAAVEDRRKEAIRSKEAKEAVKETKETSTVKEAAKEVRDLAHSVAHLAHWSGSVLGDYLESMKISMNNQSRLLESLHAKQDWQSKEILKLQILLITQKDNELKVETAKTPEKDVEIKDNQDKEREPTNSENTERLNPPQDSNQRFIQNYQSLLRLRKMKPMTVKAMKR